MKEKYQIILNMNEEMLNKFKKSFEEEGYEIIAEEENILFIGKDKTQQHKKELTKEQIKLILSICKKQTRSEILFVDITTAVQHLLKMSEENTRIDGKFSWIMRESFLKAKLGKM